MKKMPENEAAVLAPAKVNLYLHVVGKRPDGYHLLDSLFVFADCGDVVRVFPSDRLTLEITGPFSAGLPVSQDNTVLKAARALARAADVPAAARIVLEKNLPVASGIGGGSSDAAAVLKALLKLWNLSLPEPELYALALSLGADVPACLKGKAVGVSGIGEILTEAPSLPELSAVLVNPNRPVSTPAVFKKRSGGFSAPEPIAETPADVRAFIGELKRRRNDLTAAAEALEPSVSEVLTALEACPGCSLARMSGSGGTCFGIFEKESDRRACVDRLCRKYPFWWVQSAKLL